jgi:multiple antibiotic resistance protein
VPLSAFFRLHADETSIMHDYAQATLTVLSLINPAICGAIFSARSKGMPFRSRVTDATRVMLAVALILLLAALFGAKLLHLFGISLDAFEVAGGLVLMWMGSRMLSGGGGSAAAPAAAGGGIGASAKPPISSAETDSASLMPLILFAASPGTITGVIALSVNHARLEIPPTALVAVLLSVAVTWLLMVLVALRGDEHTSGVPHELATRFMGVIVLAMGVQFLFTGTKAFFGGG